MKSFKSGEVWLDTDGNPIQAHGGQVTYHNGKYYWYGENKDIVTDKVNCPYWHNGVRCYRSDDLYNWVDCGTILEPSDDINSPLCRRRIIDRPHILYNKKTDKFVMWIKLSGTPEKPMDWSVQHAGIAVCDRIDGKYQLIKEFYPNGECMGDFDFIEDPATGEMFIYFSHIIGPNPADVLCMKLTDDYLGVTEGQISYFPYGAPPESRESPAFFRHGGKIYLSMSGTTGYNPNPTILSCAAKCEGPWEELGEFCVGDTTKSTFHSQISCVLKHPERDLYIAMADRWLVDLDLKYLPLIREGYRILQSTPPVKTDLEWKDVVGIVNRDTCRATYVWLPIKFDQNGRPYIQWVEDWKIEDFPERE